MPFIPRPFFKGLLLGAALLLAGVVALGIWLQQSNRIILTGVGPWIETAVKTEFLELSVTSDTKVFAEFKFSAENMTNTDYALPEESNTVFVRDPGNKGLTQTAGLVWPSGQYLPSNRKVIVKFTVPFEFTEAFTSADARSDEKLTSFVSRQLKDIGGFAVLDRHTRYEIVFPMPLRELKQGSSPEMK